MECGDGESPLFRPQREAAARAAARRCRNQKREPALAHSTFYVVVVVGGVSGIVVVPVPVVTPGFGPSLPVDGCGGAWPVAPVAGASVFVSGGLVTSGGAF